MPTVVISDLPAPLLDRLRERALTQGRSLEAEAKFILETALQQPTEDVWAEVDEIHNELAASGRTFCDSVELLREDRAR